MSENEIKPVAWRCIWKKSGKPAWEQYHDESDPMPEQWDCRPNEVRPLYGQSAIDRLLEKIDRLEMIESSWLEFMEKTEWVQKSSEPGELGLHRADVLKSRIDCLTAERDAALASVDANWVSHQRVVKAESERDAAVEDAERYRWIRLRIGGREAVEDDFKWEYESGECLAQEVDAAIDAARSEGRV